MRYTEEIEGLLNKIECVISAEYDESIKDYQAEIARLNAVIDAYKELLIDSQKRENKCAVVV